MLKKKWNSSFTSSICVGERDREMRRIVLLHSPSMNHSLFAVCVFSFFLWNHASVWDERRIITNFQHRISTLINGKFFSSTIKLDSCAFLINSSLLFRSDAKRIESWNWKINDSWRLQKKEMFGFLSHATSESSIILNDHRQIIRSNSILRSWGLSQYSKHLLKQYTDMLWREPIITDDRWFENITREVERERRILSKHLRPTKEWKKNLLGNLKRWRKINKTLKCRTKQHQAGSLERAKRCIKTLSTPNTRTKRTIAR